MNLLLCIYLAVFAAQAPILESPLMGLLGGQSDLSAMTGNGRLTVGVNPYGQVCACRWPSPGYWNQVKYRTRAAEAPMPGVAADNGLTWGLRVNQETVWLRGAPWQATQRYAGDASTIVETVTTLPETAITATQTLFVDPFQDVLVARLTVGGAETLPAIYWFANFSPCTRMIPEWPIADWAVDAWNDFAVFTLDSGKTVFHFRPRQPGAAAWTKAESLAAAASLDQTAEWDSFGEGVWIAYASPNRVAAFECGIDGDASSALDQAAAGNLAGRAAATGACHSAIALAPETENGKQVVTVFATFGKNREQAMKALAYAAQRGFPALVEETDAYWAQRLSVAALPVVDDAALLDACRRDLLTILQCQDRETGAVVRSPAAQPPLALDWPRHGAWITYALDLAGCRDLAEAHTLFYRDAVRKAGKPAKPRGSMPAACYADHIEALPHVILQSDAAAWMLGSCWRHAGFLDTPRRTAYLTTMWDAVNLAADFLVDWTDGRTRKPLYSFNPAMCRDTQSPQALLTTYMGIDAALRIAAALGKSPPAEWTHRKRDLDALIRFHLIAANDQWKQDVILPFWQTELAQMRPKLPSWAPIVERRLGDVDRSQRIDPAALCDAALIWQARPDKLARLRPALNATTAPLPFPDALAAAQHLIAASLIYASPR